MRWTILAVLVMAAPVQAGEVFWPTHPDQFQKPTIAQARAACSADARRVCPEAYAAHDSQGIVACFKERRNKLSPGCATVLTAMGQ